MGLLKRNWGASLRTFGRVSLSKFQWRGLKTLVNIKEMLWARVLGKMADRVESA